MTRLIVPLFFWLIGLFLMWNVKPIRKRKDPTDLAVVPSRRISVIIPARDEERRIRKLLSSLVKQTLEPYEIIVVDDESGDNTALTAQEYNVHLIKGKKAENGWLGKPWACMQGAEYSHGDVLLFLDADTWLSPRGLEDIATEYAKQSGLITVQPYHVTVKMYEQLSAFFNIIVMAGLNAFTPFGSSLRPSGGFGPCVMCSRDDYFAVGGHGAAKGKVLEDIALARTFSEKGYKVGCYSGRGVISFRMYPDGLRSMIEGWTKGFAEGSASIRKLFLLLIILWITGSFESFINLFKFSDVSDVPLIWASVFVYCVYALQILWMLHRIGCFKVWTALLFPISLIFFALIMGWSLIQKYILKQVRWKNRVIKFDNKS